MPKGHLLITRKLYINMIDDKDKKSDKSILVNNWVKRGIFKHTEYASFKQNIKMYLDHPDFLAAQKRSSVYDDQYVLEFELDTAYKLKLHKLKYWTGVEYEVIVTYDQRNKAIPVERSIS